MTLPRQLGRYKRPPEERKKVVRFDPGAPRNETLEVQRAWPAIVKRNFEITLAMWRVIDLQSIKAGHSFFD